MINLSDYSVLRPSNFEFAFSVAVVYELIEGKYLVEGPSSDNTKTYRTALNIKELPEPDDFLVKLAYAKIQQSEHAHDLKLWVTRFQGWTLESGTHYQLSTSWVKTYAPSLKDKGILRDIDSSSNNKYYLAEDFIKFHIVKLIERGLLGNQDIQLNNSKLEQKILLCSFLYGYFGFTAMRFTRSELESAKKQLKEVILPKLNETAKSCVQALQQATK